MADEARLDRLDRLARMLAAAPLNLVARGERSRIREVHVAEAEHMAGLIGPLGAGERWLDLGTGGGLPGLVLAVLAPDVHWTLLDSVHKKTAAVASFARELGLDNVDVVTGRAEEVARDPVHREAYDGVVARAVAALDVLAELARGFVRPGGRLVAVKGPRWEEELLAAGPTLQALRLRVHSSVAVPDAVRPTWLVTLVAEGTCPPRFPRRVGVPRSQPLGGRPS